MNPAQPDSTLAGGVALGAPPADLVARLLAELAAASGASAAVVLQRSTRSDDYIASASCGFADVTALRLRGSEAKAVDSLSDGAPALSSLDNVPSLAAGLGTNIVGAIAVAGTRRPAYLVVAHSSAAMTPDITAALTRGRAEFGLALELDRLAREAAIHQRLRELFLAFSRSLSGLSVPDALQASAQDANTIFEARRTSVWLYDRGARHLSLVASSQPTQPGEQVILTTDGAAPAARGLRLERPRMLVGPSEQVLIAPLRGWRRALGTLVIEGQFATFDDEQLVEFAHELARQLAVGVENAQLIQEVLRHRERLSQSEKLASLGQFVAGIAHEMNNPLQGVLGHLELLMRTSAQARPLRAQLKRIYGDAERAAKIVRNLLVFTGSRRMARRRISVESAVRRALASRAAALRASRIRVVRREGKDLPYISGDALLLQQALLNVVMNAEHAIAAGGGDGRIELATKYDRARKLVVMTIRDTGTGIAADALPRIFDPFFTTKDVGKGTGLGLAITYGIIQEHGGTIQAANAAGGGALFTIELPAVDP